MTKLHSNCFKSCVKFSFFTQLKDIFAQPTRQSLWPAVFGLYFFRFCFCFWYESLLPCRSQTSFSLGLKFLLSLSNIGCCHSQILACLGTPNQCKLLQLFTASFFNFSILLKKIGWIFLIKVMLCVWWEIDLDLRVLIWWERWTIQRETEVCDAQKWRLEGEPFCAFLGHLMFVKCLSLSDSVF